MDLDDYRSFAEGLREGRPDYPEHLIRLYYALQDAPTALFAAVNEALPGASGQWPDRETARAALKRCIEWLEMGVSAIDDAHGEPSSPA